MPNSANQPPQAPASLVENDVRPIAHIERKAALLLVTVASLVLAFLGYVMYARGVFESTQQLVLLSDDSEGVMVGMDLTFSGFPIGRVRRIELAADGKARMVIDVPRKDAHWLRTSSIFTMERGMVGDTRIRAFSGILTDPPLPANAERTVLRGDTNAEIPRIVASTRAVLENLESMTGSESSINASLKNLRSVTDKLNGRYGFLAAALGSDDKAKKIIAMIDQINGLLLKTDQRIYGPNGVMDGTQASVAQLTGLLKDARASLLKIDGVLAEAQIVATNARMASTDLGALRAEVELSLRKVGQLVDEVNRKWPFARDVEIKLP